MPWVASVWLLDQLYNGNGRHNEAAGTGEWIWVRVHHRDGDRKKLVFCALYIEPVNHSDGKVE